MQNKLNGLTTYLIGPIEAATDLGVGWRKEIKTLIVKYGLNIKILDPTHKPKDLVSETKKEQQYIQELKEKGQWDEVTRFIKKIRRIDLRMVDKSDFLIAYYDKDTQSIGSIHEIIVATEQQKCVLLLAPKGKKSVNTWLFSLIDHEHIFETSEQLVKYLAEINNGSVITDDRWVFLYT